MGEWSSRLTIEIHTGFSGCPVAFLDIAFQAGRCHIIPGVDTASRARHDMVDCQVVSSYSAILAGVIITMENIAPREAYLFVRDFHIMPEPDYHRHRRIGIDEAAFVLYLLGLAFQEQYDGTPPGTYVKRLV